MDDQGSAKDTLEFELKVRCKRNPNAPENSKNPNELYIDNNVYTKHMRWIPKPGQLEMFKGITRLAYCSSSFPDYYESN